MFAPATSADRRSPKAFSGILRLRPVAAPRSRSIQPAPAAGIREKGRTAARWLWPPVTASIFPASARRIEAADFDRFDLILAMDQDNLKNLRKIAPAEALGRLHLFNALALGDNKDIPDPYYGGHEGFEAVYTMLLAGCNALLPRLGKALRAS